MAITTPDWITDPDDFCRQCHGNGYVTERLEGGRTMSEPCHLCGGSGVRTVKIFNPAAVNQGERTNEKEN